MINPDVKKREELLFAYSLALEQGNFARIESILEQAASDPILERQLLEINSALTQLPGKTNEPDGEKIIPVSVGQWIKTIASGVISSPFWRRPIRRITPLAIVLGIVLILLIGVWLGGPALYSKFQNIVLYSRTSGANQTSLIQSQNQAYLAQLSSTPYVQNPYLRSQGQAYPAQPTPTVYVQFPGVAATPTPFLQSYNAKAYPAPGSQLPAARLIVRNGYLVLVAKDTRQARQAVMALVADFAAEGAFVVSSNETYPSNDQLPVIDMTLRVPVNRFDESMTRLAGLGTQVLSRQENAQDVTQAYVDVSARIEALQTSRDRLLEIIKEAKTTDDLLRAEQELSQRESELDAAKANQQYLAQTSALSSITLEIRPAITSQPVTDSVWNPAVTFHDAEHTLITDLIGLADGFIYFVITTLPWLIVVGLLGYGIVRFVRAKMKK